MSVTLYPHQIDAIKKMKNGSILVGGVGSGKSRTSLGYFYKEHGGGFSPVTGNVENEERILGYRITKEMDEKPRTLIIITTAKKRDSMEWEDELLTYNMSTNMELNQYGNRIIVDSWNNISKYSKAHNCFFIFDEQRVGGTGKWAKTFIKIARENKWILLSATPGDTWSDYAPVFIANGFYKNFTEFRTRHCVYSRFAKYPKIDHYVECDILEQHRADVLVYMKFERKTVAHKNYIHVEYPKDDYETVSKKRWDIYKNEPCQEIATVCAVLRKVVNSDVSRIEKIHELLQEHPKAIIFYNYDYELEILRKYCEDTKYIYAEWNGHKHEEVPIGDKWLYLVQYRAGAEGWNCITTDTIIFYSLTYSYKDSVQAAGRIDRMNTQFVDLNYFYLISSSKIDLAISKCLRGKKNFNEKSFIENERKVYS